ncbi:MAG: hypothetical protein PHR92_07345 [Lachnospiraceae bacterium]|nr:hypothetical protein [Lachnospiraceae bacterium]
MNLIFHKKEPLAGLILAATVKYVLKIAPPKMRALFLCTTNKGMNRQ